VGPKLFGKFSRPSSTLIGVLSELLLIYPIYFLNRDCWRLNMEYSSSRSPLYFQIISIQTPSMQSILIDSLIQTKFDFAFIIKAFPSIKQIDVFAVFVGLDIWFENNKRSLNANVQKSQTYYLTYI
jgi:hypothetical protein